MVGQTVERHVKKEIRDGVGNEKQKQKHEKISNANFFSAVKDGTCQQGNRNPIGKGGRAYSQQKENRENERRQKNVEQKKQRGVKKR
jgi:hypothetical protein